MNNQARNCELKCKYNVQGICSTYGKCISNELFIEELEQIKSEINDIPNWVKPQMVKNDMVKLLNEHISKLKGDNNVDKSNV